MGALLLTTSRVPAHPLGAASINRYLDFQYEGAGRFRVAYLLDLAEGPAFAEIDALDADHDGAVTPDEQQRYLDSRLPVLLATCEVEIDGVRVTPSIVARHVDTPPGEGGHQTVRIAAELVVVGRAPPAGPEVRLHVHDEGFSGVVGWREIHAEDAWAPGEPPARATPTEAGASPTRTMDARFAFRARSASFANAEPASRSRYALAAAVLALAGVAGALVARRLRLSRA